MILFLRFCSSLYLCLFYIIILYKTTFSLCDETTFCIPDLFPVREHSLHANKITVLSSKSLARPLKKKKITYFTLVAAKNDLAPFARKNIKEMVDVGSNDSMNIVVQLHTWLAGNKQIAQRYYVEKGHLISLVNERETIPTDSGKAETLIDFCAYVIKNFPADHYVLNLWNHGTGALEIVPRKSINVLPLFWYNAEANMIELDRSIPFSEYIQEPLNQEQRGICFDDETGHYISNIELDRALEKIRNEYMRGEKFSIVCFDACLMAMFEIATIMKKHAHYMVASQEVELGTGYDYRKILTPLVQQPMSMTIKDFARHIVHCYEQTYKDVTNDYTQSALDLSYIALLEESMQNVISLLLKCLNKQKNKSVLEAIKTSRHKLFCTHFDEPSYIDLYHFLSNVLHNINRFQLDEKYHKEHLASQLTEAIKQCLSIINQTVIANATGKNLSKAQGISIYFPERRIHSTYYQSNFWTTFLKSVLSLQ